MYEIDINKLHTGTTVNVSDILKARRALNYQDRSTAGLLAKVVEMIGKGVALTVQELQFCDEYAQNELAWRYHRRMAMAAGEKNPKRGTKFAKLRLPAYIP